MADTQTNEVSLGYKFTQKEELRKALTEKQISGIDFSKISEIREDFSFTTEEFAAFVLTLKEKQLSGGDVTSIVSEMITNKTREKLSSMRKNMEVKAPLALQGTKETLEAVVANPAIAPTLLSESFFGQLFSRGYGFSFVENGVKIEKNDSQDKQSVSELNTLVNGYITSKKISLDSMRSGLLYNTSAFGEFVSARTDAEGKVLDADKSTLKQYVDILKAKNPRTLADDAFISAYGDGLSFAALETTAVSLRADSTKKVTEVISPVIAGAIKTGTIDTSVGKIDVSSEEAQKSLKNFNGKKFSEDFIKAPVGTTINLVGDIVKASGSSAPIVLLGFLFLGFKALTGEIKGVAGWKILLGGLFAHGVAKAFGGPEALAKVIDGVGNGKSSSSGKKKGEEGGEDGEDGEDEEGDEEEKKEEEEKITPAQKSLHDRLTSNKPLETKINTFLVDEKKKGSAGKTGSLTDYANFISSPEIQKLSIEHLLLNQNHIDSVFSLNPSLSAHIKLPDNLDPLIFKRVMRVYLTTKDAATKSDRTQDPGVPEKESFLGKYTINPTTAKDKSMKDVVGMIYDKEFSSVASTSPANPPSKVENVAVAASNITVKNSPQELTVKAEMDSGNSKITINFSPEVIIEREKKSIFTIANKETTGQEVRFKWVDYKMSFANNEIAFTKKV